MEPTIWEQRWKNIEPAALAIIEDTMLFLIFLGALTIVYVGLTALTWVGYDDERINLLETIHYDAYLVVLGPSWSM
jgi:hypothetical protein